MTVRRTKQAEAILELRLALADAGRVLMDTPPDSLPGALVAARRDVTVAWDRAAKAEVGS